MITRILPALALVLASCAYAAQSQPPTPSAGDKEQGPAAQQAKETETKTDTRGTKAEPLIVLPVRSEEQAAEDRADRLDDQANRRQAFWLSVVTLLVLGFQVKLLMNQNRIIENQTATMEGQRTAADKQSTYMREGLEHTKVAANAAAASAAFAERSVTGTQRAFLALQGFQSRSMSEHIMRATDGSIAGFVFSPTIVNAGQTPAIHAQCKLSTDKRPFAACPMPRPDEEPPFPGDAPTVTIGPQASMMLNRAIITTDEARAIIRGTMFFHLHVVMKYNDFFPNTPIRQTWVCTRVDFHGDPDGDPAQWMPDFRSGATGHNYID